MPATGRYRRRPPPACAGSRTERPAAGLDRGLEPREFRPLPEDAAVSTVSPSNGQVPGLELAVLQRFSGDRHHAYLANGGALEHAQEMAAHESPRTTKLYDRTKERLTQDEVERIRL